MSSQINLEYLRVFFYVAKYKNITRAAKALYLTQPAATRVLRLLEGQLETQLFIRSSRGVALTPEGELLYLELIPAFESLENAQEKLFQMKALEQGFVHVGCNNLASEYIMGFILNDFHKKYPNVEITLSRVQVSHLNTLLENGQIDFAISIDIGNQQSPEDMLENEYLISNKISRTIVGSFEDALLVGPRYAYMSHQKTSVEELSMLPLIVPIKQRNSTLYYTNLFRKEGRLADYDMTVNGAESRLALAKRNLGLTYFPLAFVKDELAARTLFQVNSDVVLQKNTLSLLSIHEAGRTIAASKLFEHILNMKY